MDKKKTPAPRRAGTDRNEWLALMLELAQLDRAAYREMRADLWALIASRHGDKSSKQLADWMAGAS